MAQRKKIWIGGMGIGVDLVCVAAAALGAPRPVWVLALFIGTGLILYAVFVGEPDAPALGMSQNAGGGSGAGDVRGNVFGANATINVSHRPQSSNPLGNRDLIRVSPTDLVNLHKEHTEVQAVKLTEPYIGGRIEVKGEVYNVSRPDPSDGHRVSISIEDSNELAFAEFPESAQEQLPRLRRDDPIHVIGRISQITSLGISVEDCEFVD